MTIASKYEKTTSLAHAAQEVADVLLMLSIPLYVEVRGRPWLCGTGFIVQKGERYCLVSAAHVLDHSQENGLFYYIGPKRPRVVRGQMVRSSRPETRSSDPLDIGVIQLVGGEMPPYSEVEKVATPFSWLRPKRVPREGKNYMIVGFPQSKSTVSSSTFQVEVTACPYRANSLSDAELRALGLEPAYQLAMHLDLKVGYDPDGNHRNFPKPMGISGAPIIELYDELGEDDPSIFPIVGVGVEHHKSKRVLLGTDIGAVSEVVEALSNIPLEADASAALAALRQRAAQRAR